MDTTWRPVRAVVTLVRPASSRVARACRAMASGVGAFLSRPPLGYRKLPEQAFTRTVQLYLARWRLPAIMALGASGAILLGLIAALVAWPSTALVSATIWAGYLWAALFGVGCVVIVVRPRPPLEALGPEEAA